MNFTWNTKNSSIFFLHLYMIQHDAQFHSYESKEGSFSLIILECLSYIHFACQSFSMERSKHVIVVCCLFIICCTWFTVGDFFFTPEINKQIETSKPTKIYDLNIALLGGLNFNFEHGIWTKHRIAFVTFQKYSWLLILNRKMSTIEMNFS